MGRGVVPKGRVVSWGARTPPMALMWRSVWIFQRMEMRIVPKTRAGIQPCWKGSLKILSNIFGL